MGVGKNLFAVKDPNKPLRQKEGKVHVCFLVWISIYSQGFELAGTIRAREHEKHARIVFFLAVHSMLKLLNSELKITHTLTLSTQPVHRPTRKS